MRARLLDLGDVSAVRSQSVYHAITALLCDTGYQGWIVVEDESDGAIPEPDQVTMDDWAWLERELVPMLG